MRDGAQQRGSLLVDGLEQLGSASLGGAALLHLPGDECACDDGDEHEGDQRDDVLVQRDAKRADRGDEGEGERGRCSDRDADRRRDAPDDGGDEDGQHE